MAVLPLIRGKCAGLRTKMVEISWHLPTATCFEPHGTSVILQSTCPHRCQAAASLPEVRSRVATRPTQLSWKSAEWVSDFSGLFLAWALFMRHMLSTARSFTARRHERRSGQMVRREGKVETMSKVGVLIVDDDADIRALLGTVLEEEGYPVYEAADA